MALAQEAGFHRVGIVEPRRLAAWSARLPPEPSGLDWTWVTEAPRWARTCTVLVCCLSCLRREPDDLGSTGDPHALIAPFARAHYYREAVRMLARMVRRLEERSAVPRASVRLFSNSRMPEKLLLAATGMAAYGRNGCMIAPGLGSLFVIAGAVIPVPTPVGVTPPPLEDPCGSCRACRAACPAGAIDEPYHVDAARCLQSVAANLRDLDETTMRRWGARLYGCQECQAVCPRNQGLSVAARSATGEIGPSVPLRALLSEDAAQRAARFRGTALGMSWVPPDAILRNALLAAGNRGDPSVAGAVERHLRGPAAAPVRAAARWAMSRL